jgi:hypothetical protein
VCSERGLRVRGSGLLGQDDRTRRDRLARSLRRHRSARRWWSSSQTVATARAQLHRHRSGLARHEVATATPRQGDNVPIRSIRPNLRPCAHLSGSHVAATNVHFACRTDMAYRDDLDGFRLRRAHDADEAVLHAAFARGERARRKRSLALSLGGILLAIGAIAVLHTEQPPPLIPEHRESLSPRREPAAERAATKHQCLDCARGQFVLPCLGPQALTPCFSQSATNLGDSQ